MTEPAYEMPTLPIAPASELRANWASHDFAQGRCVRCDVRPEHVSVWWPCGAAEHRAECTREEADVIHTRVLVLMTPAGSTPPVERPDADAILAELASRPLPARPDRSFGLGDEEPF